MDAMTSALTAIPTTRPDVLLRRLTPEDARPLFLLIDDNRMHLSKFGDNTAVKYPTYESVLRSITHNPNPDKFRFGVWRETELLGSANLTPSHPLFSGSGQIGYWIGSQYVNQGIATIVAKALVAYAKNELHWSQLSGFVHKNNGASQEVLYRAGLRPFCEKDGLLQYRTRFSR